MNKIENSNLTNILDLYLSLFEILIYSTLNPLHTLLFYIHLILPLFIRVIIFYIIFYIMFRYHFI